MTLKQLSNWFKMAIEKSLNVEDKYKRVNRSFHQAVWDRLMIMGPKQTEEEGGGYEIVANILCNYAQVKQAAQKVQKYPKFKDDKNIQSLKFSDGWVCKFIAVNDMARRRSTVQGDKTIASDNVINEELKKAHDKIFEEVQRQIRINNVMTYEDILRCIWNFDETGITYKIGPLFGFVPKKGKHSRVRTTKGESNKDRIILARSHGLCIYTYIFSIFLYLLTNE